MTANEIAVLMHPHLGAEIFDSAPWARDARVLLAKKDLLDKDGHLTERGGAYARRLLDTPLPAGHATSRAQKAFEAFSALNEARARVGMLEQEGIPLPDVLRALDTSLNVVRQANQTPEQRRREALKAAHSSLGHNGAHAPTHALHAAWKLLGEVLDDVR